MARFELSRKVVNKQYEKLLPLADSVSYSLKTNPEVGKVLEEDTDCYFSVHSLRALERLRDAGRVWYFAQGWSVEEVEEVLEKGADKFVVDNEQDLDIFMDYLEDTNLEVSLLLRKRLKEYTVQTGKRFVYGFFSKEVNDLIPQLKDHPNIDRLGIHMHRKTQNVSEWGLKKQLRNSLEGETLEAIDVVNIGGGLPSVYKNYSVKNMENIKNRIRNVRKWLDEKSVEMVVEPGRYIAAPAVNLICNVKAVYKDNIIVDCSIFNAALDTFLENIRLEVEGEKEESEQAYTIKGCTPDSKDIFRYKVFLEDPDVGDEIVFKNAGAYNFHTDFCFLPELETEIV